MSYQLAGARLKLERAVQLLDTLNTHISEFCKSPDKPYKLSVKQNLKTKVDCIVINIVRAPPPLWSLQIGEIIYNLRSALDHMAYEIASVYNNGEVPPGTEFPIFIDADRFRDSKRGGGLYKVRGVPENVRTSIGDMQPFQKRESPELHRLWALQELSNWDKHRLLHLTSVIAGARNIVLKSAGGISIKTLSIRQDGEVQDGTELVRYQVTRLRSNGRVEMNGDIIYSIAFDKAGPAKGSLVSEGLRQLVDVVSEVITIIGNLPPLSVA